MRYTYQYTINDAEQFKQKLLSWGNGFDCFAFLDSNDINKNSSTKHRYCSFELIAGIGAIETMPTSAISGFSSLKTFTDNTKDWLFGFFSYDLKNETEALGSDNYDGLGFPDIHFFQPKYLITLKDNQLTLGFYPGDNPENEALEIIKKINAGNTIYKDAAGTGDIHARISKASYIDKVEKIKEHIRRGDIFQLNFCQEFYSTPVEISPVQLFQKLRSISPTPFSCFYKLHNLYALSASPERFIKKEGQKILSQPMKGTIKRGKTEKDDVKNINELLHDSKELAENTMIVDLVRNDLARTAVKGSVHVEELYKIYTYPQVHQMVSTITASVKDGVHPVDIIKNAFPMGSMTGAPKVKAMELIEKYESTRRGLYSGAIGYITPEQDFDFNVVIRTILYNETKKYLSFSVGGAITSYSIPEKEYEECMIKASAMQKALNLHYS